MSNGPNLFATSFFREIEDHEKKKSTGNVTRQEIGGTCKITTGPCGGAHIPLIVLSMQSWTPRIHLDLKTIIYIKDQLGDFASGQWRNTKDMKLI
jgi:hypothetical protein